MVRKFEVVSDYIDIVTNLSKSGAITYHKLEGIILLVSKLIMGGGGTPPELKLKNPNLCEILICFVVSVSMTVILLVLELWHMVSKTGLTNKP